MNRMESCPRQALLLAGGLLALALALPLLLIAPAQAAPAAALTVCPAGPPDCGYSIVQDAVDAAQPGTTIKIAIGTYTGVNHHGGLAQVVYVDKSLTLRGGYTAPAFAEPPDPEANPTTLDALGLGRVLYVSGSIDATVEGLRITGGNAAGLGGYVAPWGTYDAGGGIYAITATVVLSANEIVSNTIPSQGDGSGGGVASLHSNVALVGNRVRGNDADRGGGLNLRYCIAQLDGNTFSANTADSGGGIYLYESTSSLEANTIVSNTAGAGGGVYASEGDTTLLQTELISNTAFYGGGLYAWDGYLISNHAAFRGNTADNDGGGLFVRGSEVTLLDSDITGNTAEFSGGGLYLDQSPATLGRNTISDNRAGDYGGGLYLDQSQATLSTNTLRRNSADLSGGGVSSSGSDAALLGNMVISNTAGMVCGGGCSGAGLHVDQGTVMLIQNVVRENILIDPKGWGAGVGLWSTNAIIDANVISDNWCDWVGGGMSLQSTDATLEGNTILSNTAEFGGGLYAEHSDIVVTNTVIADNQADYAGSGLDSTGYGSARLVHTTIARNTGGDGSGVYAGTPLWLTNTILVGHSVGITVEADTAVTLTATLWGAGPWANGTDWAGPGTIVTGTVNVWGDPAFVDPDAGDYHVGLGSAALDAGVDAGVITDIDHQPRPYGRPDLGADEYWPPGVLRRLYLPLVFRGP